MSWQIAPTNDLTACFALRHEVFVLEQGVPLTEEQDTLDATATHILASKDGAPIGAARILFNGDTAKVGRVCVVQSARGTGLGAAIIRACIGIAAATPDIRTVKLGAQVNAIGFYEKLGFTGFGPVYNDAGIDHRDMKMELPQ
ncbi:GNAT family N-acetyltransferase [Thalassobius sp. Cn5-15]|uniref:GNAT family N-acetyltransferase n=1 Tax=Thalassobius sp. Cn5-15 TaxID=2917763 RepID=UPI001EF16318|nr:GNAT family N-acetyltransferase [Thalassobius sp. Cn5-15]MCG7494128.1 GNAT family N-acetyltransferase [Thalassobius sp. Cn5-15]